LSSQQKITQQSRIPIELGKAISQSVNQHLNSNEDKNKTLYYAEFSCSYIYSLDYTEVNNMMGHIRIRDVKPDTTQGMAI